MDDSYIVPGVPGRDRRGCGVTDDAKAKLDEVLAILDDLHPRGELTYNAYSQLHDRVSLVLDALEAAQVPATDDDREARKAAYDEAWGYRHDTRSAGEKNHYEFWFNRGWDAAAGFRRSSRVPVSRDELAAWMHRRQEFEYDVCDHGKQLGSWAGPDDTYAMCERWAEAFERDHDIYPKADRQHDEDVPGGCVYCGGSGVVEDVEGDRDCSGCDGTGTPRDRTPADSSNGDDRG